LPQGIFQELPALDRLYLFNNPILLSYTGLPYGDNIDFLNVMHAFFNNGCESPFARVYRLAAGGATPEAVREAFLQLPDAIKNTVFGKVWVEADCPPTDDPRWGETHAFEDISRFYGALKRYVKEGFEALSDGQKNTVYGHVYNLARNAQGSEAIDFSDPEWGRTHAFDNILRLIDAMARLQADS
jgi:hypothetical protein